MVQFGKAIDEIMAGIHDKTNCKMCIRVNEDTLDEVRNGKLVFRLMKNTISIRGVEIKVCAIEHISNRGTSCFLHSDGFIHEAPEYWVQEGQAQLVFDRYCS